MKPGTSWKLVLLFISDSICRLGQCNMKYEKNNCPLTFVKLRGFTSSRQIKKVVFAEFFSDFII